MSKTPSFLIRMSLAVICLVGLAATATALFPTSASAQQLRRCANEGGICRLPYPTEVVYGARGRMTSRFFDRRAVPCSNRVFGDPAPGREKACYFVARGGDYGGDDNYGGDYGSRPDSGEWVACAREGDFCDFRGRAMVRYGARGRYTQDVFRNGVDCSNEAFGDDPAPGAHKRCYIRQ